MNSIVLMGDVATRPELRETQDGLARASFVLHFSAFRPEEPDYQVQVVAFGNVAGKVNEQLVQGDRVIVEGRLQMNSITRQDGVREKRAEVIVRQFHPVSQSQTQAPKEIPAPKSSTPLPVPPPPPLVNTPPSRPAYKSPPPRPTPDLPTFNNDEIPF